jgi:Protein of unknown function (DUF3485)
MSRYLPIAAGVLLIVGLTIVQVRMTDRFSEGNFTALQRAELLKNVPMNIGDWQGTDMEVAESVKQTAGAEGAPVSRRYRNSRTGEEVDLWLIVGHGRPISAHTPDICYPSSGFHSRAAENSVHTMVMENETQVPFLTNTFFREDSATGRRLYRVFWTWYNTENDANNGKVVWEAPTNARWYFGNTRALYKMYFTSVMRDPGETAEKSAAVNFANDFLPVVNKALSMVYDGNAAPAGATTAGETAPESTSEDATTEVEKADVEPAGATEVPPEAAEPVIEKTSEQKK